MPTQAERFAALFAGLDRAYGQYDLSKPTVRQRDGKLEGRAWTVKKTPTLEVWKAHLEGRMGLGIPFLKDDDTVGVAAFDVDVYPLDMRDVYDRVQLAKLPLVVCRSKSEGAHCYVFFKGPRPKAFLARQRVAQWVKLLGYRPETEVFPKHDHIEGESSWGNWINLPYFAGDRTVRYALGPDGALSLDEFLDLAEASRVTTEWLEAWKPPAVSNILSLSSPSVSVVSPLSELSVSSSSPPPGDAGARADDADLWMGAPPCLQTLAITGYEPGTRNNGLFAIGVYIRKRYGDRWRPKLVEYNDLVMDPPKSTAEMMAIGSSLTKKNYSYPCNKAPIAQVCDKLECLTRQYGITEGITDKGADGFPVVLGKLYKVDSDPPVWRVQVDGRFVDLSTEQLFSQRLFILRVFEETTTLMPPIKNSVWKRILQDKSDQVEIIAVASDTTLAGQVATYLTDFCTGRSQAKSLDEILTGRPWTFGGRTYFLPASFVEFLSSHKLGYTRQRLGVVLADLGLEEHEEVIKGKPVIYWSVSERAGQDQPHDVPRSGDGGPF
jgi:hypothetical protein